VNWVLFIIGLAVTLVGWGFIIEAVGLVGAAGISLVVLGYWILDRVEL
jgi:hypothetical protein